MLRIVAIDETGCPNLVETSDEEAIKRAFFNILKLIFLCLNKNLMSQKKLCFCLQDDSTLLEINEYLRSSKLDKTYHPGIDMRMQAIKNLIDNLLVEDIATELGLIDLELKVIELHMKRVMVRRYHGIKIISIIALSLQMGLRCFYLFRN